MIIGFIILIIYLGFILIIFGTLVLGFILAAPWVPSRARDVNRILSSSQIKPGEVLYDLGSGDGRLIIAAARDFKAYSVGYEVAVLPYFVSCIKIILNALVTKVKVKFKNFYNENLGNADVITAFLSPRAMEKLKDKFSKELKKGTRVISYVFKIPGWEPVEINKPNPKDLPIFIYKI